MSKIQFEVYVANAIVIDVANDLLRVWWIAINVLGFLKPIKITVSCRN